MNLGYPNMSNIITRVLKEEERGKEEMMEPWVARCHVRTAQMFTGFEGRRPGPRSQEMQGATSTWGKQRNKLFTKGS